MASALIDGIATRYEMLGDGEPLLMFAPGGFDATVEKWSALGIYARTRMLAPLAQRFRCILFDRRECGQSGGRVEPLTWRRYAEQGRGLLAHLGIERAHVMGGCMGCAPAVALAVAAPEAVRSLVLYWPVGGAKYRMRSQDRFAQHEAFVRREGLAAVIALARTAAKSFGEEPKAGPWASVLRRDASFADGFLRLSPEQYIDTVTEMARNLFDRDTAPGAEPEALLRLEIPALVVPGRDDSHATSAARYLEECLPRAQYWDVPPAEQTEPRVRERLLEFLQGAL